MAIQSSINSLLSQAQSLAAFYRGFKKADDLIKGQEDQLEAANNLQKTIDENYKGFADDYNNRMFDNDGKLTEIGKEEAQHLYNQNRKGIRFGDKYVNDFYNDSRVQDYLKPFIEKYEKKERQKNVLFDTAIDSAINAQATNSELKNEVAGKVAKMSVKSRTDSINQAKADFNAHTESLIKKYER